MSLYSFARLRRLLALAFALVTASASLTGCDALEPQRTEQAALVASARTWFDAQQAERAGKTGSDDSLTTFFPDWQHGEVVAGASGERAVVTRLWRNARVSYNDSLYFLRVLAVVVNEAGEVQRGRIVEFSSRDSLGAAEGPRLVQQWLRRDFAGRNIDVAERDVDYTFLRGDRYEGGRAVHPFVLREELCERVGKSMVMVERCTRYYIGQYGYYIGDDLVVTSLYTEWSCTCVSGCSGAGGDEAGGGGSGGGGGSTGPTDPGYAKPEGMVALVKAIYDAIQQGAEIDDPALWRRLFGAYSPQGAQCVDAAIAATGAVAGQPMNPVQFAAVVNCAAQFLTASTTTVAVDGSDLVDIIENIPGGLEWAALSASGSVIYPWLVQSSRDNPDWLRTVALNGSGLRDLHMVALLNNTSTGATHNYDINTLSALEALRVLGTPQLQDNGRWRVTWTRREGDSYVTYTAQAYPASSSNSVPSIQISPCPAYIGLTCGAAYKLRFDSYDRFLAY